MNVGYEFGMEGQKYITFFEARNISGLLKVVPDTLFARMGVGIISVLFGDGHLQSTPLPEAVSEQVRHTVCPKKALICRYPPFIFSKTNGK